MFKVGERVAHVHVLLESDVLRWNIDQTRHLHILRAVNLDATATSTRCAPPMGTLLARYVEPVLYVYYTKI